MTTGKQVFSTITSAGQLELGIADVEIPAPGPDDVVVRIEAARSTRQIWARCSVRRALLKPTCKTPSWLRPCLKTEWAWWPRASIRNCRLAMNVPAQLSPPAIATPPRHWMASWYPSCRARLTRNMLACRHQPASPIMTRPRHNVRLRLSSTR